MFSIPTFKLVNIKTLLRKLQCFVFLSREQYTVRVYHRNHYDIMHYDNEPSGLFVIFRVLNLCVIH